MKPAWRVLGKDWPNREASAFIVAGGLRWHVQILGQGPTLLLLHGTGAATHSWRDLAPMLARDFTVIAPDLPGHGFTDTPSGDGLSLNGMARSLSALLAVLEARPHITIGHSAGAALAIRLGLDGRSGTGGVVSLNGALAPFPGSAGRIYPTMAKMLFLNPIAIEVFALRARRPGAAAKLIESTGSTIDEVGLARYADLLRTTGHIAGALGMMANWTLGPLIDELPSVAFPLTLVAAEGDRAVPPSVSRDVKTKVPHADLIVLPRLGHLVHEEAPETISKIIQRAARLDQPL